MTQIKSSPTTENDDLRIVVGIPTVSRPGIVDQTVIALQSQRRLPDFVVVSAHTEVDFGTLGAAELPFQLDLVTGPKGTCSQRNLILSQLGPNDLLLFIDDDFLLAPDFLEEMARLFRDHPDIVIATGAVLADGIIGPGISFEDGQKQLAEALKAPISHRVRDVRNGYGCNMAVRMRFIIENDVRFDEALPLYGWFEDVDFSIQAAQFGRVVQADSLRGIHLGTKTGRTSGLRLGYSQVANLHYLYRKGTMGLSASLYRVALNVVSNLYRTVRPIEWADYRGRLKGNILALTDIFRGKCTPERILDL